MKRASKLPVFEFIKEKDIVSRDDLVEKVNYSSGGAIKVLSWLKRQGLVINDHSESGL